MGGRYHHRLLRTPREVRHALAYVLLNARHITGSGMGGCRRCGWIRRARGGGRGAEGGAGATVAFNPDQGDSFRADLAVAEGLAAVWVDRSGGGARKIELKTPSGRIGRARDLGRTSFPSGELRSPEIVPQPANRDREIAPTDAKDRSRREAGIYRRVVSLPGGSYNSRSLFRVVSSAGRAPGF